ncbi:hypothetical protein [Alteromonas flava]|uniref:hypothetical protein n=1 Tax=Alteromonas flava TaxID=2048003 RepID=UPI000C289216|nr:hypothetical protein [Alteromonas flava]
MEVALPLALGLLLAVPTITHAQATNEQVLLPAVSVFSSYPSASTQQSCVPATDDMQCAEDYLAPHSFFTALTSTNAFSNTVASENGYDYEVLIANVLIPSHNTQTDTRFYTMVTEFDVTWRSIPLASYTFEYGLSALLNDEQKEQFSQRLSRAFIGKAKAEQVFSADYLFAHLNASDYLQDLQLPSEIATFTLDDLQLYHDPLRGAVARYTHPDYPKDVMDIFVYPVFDPQDHMSSKSDLTEELQKDIDDITLIAQSRAIEEIKISDIQAIDWNIDSNNFQGKYFDVAAVDDGGEPLFTTTYIFQSKDKIIKFSANFPDRVATEMVKRALPKINVPEPSALMRSLREQPKS